MPKSNSNVRCYYISALMLTCCCYILALVLTCFRLKKGRATFFRPETIVASFLHLMVLSFKVLLNHSSKRQFFGAQLTSLHCLFGPSAPSFLHGYYIGKCYFLLFSFLFIYLFIYLFFAFLIYFLFIYF